MSGGMKDPAIGIVLSLREQDEENERCTPLSVRVSKWGHRNVGVVSKAGAKDVSGSSRGEECADLALSSGFTTLLSGAVGEVWMLNKV